MSKDMVIQEHDESIVRVHRANHTWLGVIDIWERFKESGPIPVTIKRVFAFKGGVFDSGRKQDGQAVEFEGQTKFLPLNATNTYTLARIGSKPSDLVGKKVFLNVEKLKRPFQQSTHGIRISIEK